MSSNARISVHLALLILLLAACSPAPDATPLATPSSPPPTHAPLGTPTGEFSLFQAGQRYSDAPEDMPVSFLDVVAFQATVDEESDTLNVLLQLRDVPEVADRGHVTNLIEYSWSIQVYLDPAETDSADYYLGLNTSVENFSASGNRTPNPGEPESVPIHELFENRIVYNSAGRPVETVQVDIDTGRNTLLFRGRVPRITSEAVFNFNMTYNEDNVDRPDNYVPPDPASLSSPLPEAIRPAFDSMTQLVPAGNVRAFPGPVHYAGDVLTFEIQSTGSFDETFTVSMALDNQTPRQVSATAIPFGALLLPGAFDTSNLIGQHMLQFTTPDGDLNETYFFEVLPAEQRPKGEENAEWLTQETDCCIFHYLSETAAARDIDLISDHFQQGADDFEDIMQAEIQSKMDVYLIDRILGNGGFGGGGKLLISYTDRYYGPTVGGAGLETLSRHEFSHAADITLEVVTEGVNFNYEGLAVYVAGGHYKPEPLAERAAAMFDLGRSVPVDEIILQHELSYLHAAAILTYIAEQYGEGKVWEFFRSDHIQDDQLLPMEDAIRSTFGISLREFDQGFQAWLEQNDPGEQLDDLRLTIELQELRREYQLTYSAQPLFLRLEEVDAVARPEYLPIVMREARAPTNIAVELIIADGQQAIVNGDYTRAEKLNETLATVIETGEFEDPLASEYLEIVLAAAGAGYEIVNLELQGDRASARTTVEPPDLVEIELQKVNGVWQVQP
ncbi:MAG: hypothetical protein M3Y68_07945 [Chloroflexota bacterium]|nr:hypothetical protein [Chloroflexota bacterium]